MTRERQLTDAFLQLADTLVDDYDVVEVLQRLVEHCVELFDAAAAGLLVVDQVGRLQLMASSTEQTRLLELFQLQTNEGPCLECFRTGALVTEPDLDANAARWPQFSAAAREQGFVSVDTVPLRLRDQTLGALGLFSDKMGGLPANDLHAAQALAHAATISILQERAHSHREVLIEQLQGALNSRVIIEQAKGILATRVSFDMDAAFTHLRAYARGTNLRLADVARALVNGDLDATALSDPSPTSA